MRPLWGHLLHPWSPSKLPGIFTLCSHRNLTRYLKGLKKELYGQKLVTLEADRNFLKGLSPKLERNYVPREKEAFPKTAALH